MEPTRAFCAWESGERIISASAMPRLTAFELLPVVNLKENQSSNPSEKIVSFDLAQNPPDSRNPPPDDVTGEASC